MPRGNIPSGWLDYTPIGKPIQGTRFLTFKVPLKKHLCSQVPESEHFTPEILLKRLKSSGWKLGLVIDLTNTMKYYDPQVFESLGIKYQKIFTEGKVVPSDQVKMKFLSVVDEFAECNPEEDLLIGVHCTHGLNRTGHLVCRYMVDRLGFEPENAIKLYNDARGHSIERENYLNDVKTCPTDMEKYAIYKSSGCPSPRRQTHFSSEHDGSRSRISKEWRENGNDQSSSVSHGNRRNPNSYHNAYERNRWPQRNQHYYADQYSYERQDNYSDWNRGKRNYNNYDRYDRGRYDWSDQECMDTRHYGYQYQYHGYKNRFNNGYDSRNSNNQRHEPYNRQYTGQKNLSSKETFCKKDINNATSVDIDKDKDENKC